MKRLSAVLFLLFACTPNHEPQVARLVKPGQEKALQPVVRRDEDLLIHHLLIFGDSLSDTGRLHRRSAGFYIPEQTYWKGRLTNGPNWNDYVCGALDCKVHSYAVAGAATRQPSIPMRWVVRPLDAQIGEFLSDEAPNPERSVAVIWIGANDYLGLADADPKTSLAAIHESVRELLKGPVQRLLIGTMPQLAGLLSQPDYVDPVSKDTYRQLTARHNLNMRGLVSELQQEYPNKSIALFDAFEINQETLDHPADFGFTSLTQNCYKGNYRGQFHGEPAFCTDYLGFKFWDYTHPNSRMHCYYGARFLLSLHEAGWLDEVDATKAKEICRTL